MFIQSDNRRAILDYLFKEGVIVAEKNMGKKHPDLPVPNLEVIQLMRSYTSKQLVKQQYAWRHYYWYLTNDGINHLREVLCLAEDVVPNTLKKTSRSMQEGGPRGADEGRRFQGGRGETRTDPSDGVEKSKRDFIQLYGGFDEWDAAGGRAGGAGGGGRGPPRGGAGDQDTRPDEDGTQRSKREFVDKYGGYTQWDAAGGDRGRGPPRGGDRGDQDTRPDEDGTQRSKREFVDKYGGYTQWDAARPRPARAPSAWDEETALDATSGESMSKRQFKDKYGGFAEWDAAKKGTEGDKPAASAEQSW